MRTMSAAHATNLQHTVRRLQNELEQTRAEHDKATEECSKLREALDAALNDARETIWFVPAVQKRIADLTRELQEARAELALAKSMILSYEQTSGDAARARLNKAGGDPANTSNESPFKGRGSQADSSATLPNTLDRSTVTCSADEFIKDPITWYAHVQAGKRLIIGESAANGIVMFPRPLADYGSPEDSDVLLELNTNLRVERHEYEAMKRDKEEALAHYSRVREDCSKLRTALTPPTVFQDQIDADKAAAEFLQSVAARHPDVPTEIVERNHAIYTQIIDGGTKSLWVAGRLAALTTVLRDDMNFSVLVCYDASAMGDE